MRYAHYTILLAVAVATGIGAVALRRAIGQGAAPTGPVVTVDKNVTDDAAAGQPPTAAPADPNQPAAETAPPSSAAPASTPPATGGTPAAGASSGGGQTFRVFAGQGRGPTVRNATVPVAAPPGASPAGGGFAPVIQGNGTTVYQAWGPFPQPVQGGWGGGESDPEAAQLHASDAHLGQAAEALIQQYGQTEDEQQRNNLKEQLSETLAKQFDVQQQLREHEIAKIEAKVKKLRDLITKRTDARKSIIDRRLDQLLREADGLGWNSPTNSAAQADAFHRYTAPGANVAPAPPTRTPPGARNQFVPAPKSNQFFIPNTIRPPEASFAPPAGAVPAPAASTPTSRPGASSAPADARQNGINNLKMILLALHNYHDANGHFPPPVLTGPDGKTPHSWRVAILPYLEQTSLYELYKFDEPWDSDNNKRVLERMPPVLRDPSADTKSKNTSYFALVGEETCFGERNGKGTRLAEILDGTANTIMVVEAKRDVPWTKPEDIVYDSARPMSGLDGIRPDDFLTGFADGSVHALSKTIDDEVLQKLITRADGKSVVLPERSARSETPE